MIAQHFALKFTEDWIAAWNSHNLDEILSHYTDDFVFESPYALQRIPSSEGKLRGKEAIRAYWKMGLDAIPDLRFEVYELFVGISGITIYYINHATQRKAAEVFFFNEQGKVNKSFAFYV